MRTILVNLLRLGGMQLVIASTAIVRNKVLALRLGPDGFSEFIQLSLIVLTASTIAVFGLGMSLNRNVAAATSDEERQRFLAQANAINLGLASLLVSMLALFAVFRPTLLTAVGLEPEPRVVVALALLLFAIPMEAAVQHRVAFLTALLDIKGMTSGRSLALVIGTAVSVPLVWFFGLAGAAVQLTLLTLLILAFLDRRCRALGYRPWAVTFDRTVLRTLLRFGTASLIAGFSLQATDLVVRSTLIRATDLAENGIYQAALSITHQVKAIVLGSVGSYSLATLSQDVSKEHVNRTVDQLLSTVLPISTVALGLLGLLSGPALFILYSAEFYPAQQVLPLLLAADYLHVMIWVVSMPLLAAGRVGVWLTFELAFLGTRFVAALVLLQGAGMVGVAAGHAVGSVVYLVLTVGYFLVVFRYALTPRNIVLFLVGVFVVVVSSWAGSRVTFDVTTYAIGTIGIALYGLLALHIVFGLTTVMRRVRELTRGGGST
jgi:O-antigen/teichoic acid export membrane protein